MFYLKFIAKVFAHNSSNPQLNMGFKTNLYKIPHLSTMTYEDIKKFERDGVTPRNPSKLEEENDGEGQEAARSAEIG